MKANQYLLAAAVASLFTTVLPGGLSTARANDNKGISSAACQPYGPGTVASDLTVSQNGIRNTTAGNKQIICPVNKDYFGQWNDTTAASLIGYFKTGGSPGQMWCTSFVGGAASNNSGLYSNTGVSGQRPALTTGSVSVQLRDPTPDNLVIENANVICTLTPGVAFGGFFYVEPDDTDGAGS